MDLDLSAEQQLFSETTARFIASTCPLTRVRDLAEDAAGFDTEYIRQAGELGWFALLVPEEYGGGTISGAGLADAAIVAEQRGRLLQPGPFVPTNVVALAVSSGGSDEARAKVLPGLASGEALASWTPGDGLGHWGPGSAPGADVRARPVAGGYLLSGARGLVQDAGSVDWLLVAAPDGDGLVQLLVPTSAAGVRVTPLAGLDLTRRFATVDFDDVLVPEWAVVAPDGGDHQLDVAVVLTVAESVGAMDRLFEVTLDYAKARTAFGRPIGSFQAIKHLLADVSLLVEESKAVSSAATRAVQQGRPDAGEVASMAKSFVGEAAIDVSQGCLQTHGGIGYTWEHDLHLYMRRLAVDRALYGDPGWHRERICAMHGL